MESDDTRKFDEFDDLLSRYLKGQLSEEEEAEFHRLISDDAELRNKAVATARLARAMAQAGPNATAPSSTPSKPSPSTKPKTSPTTTANGSGYPLRVSIAPAVCRKTTVKSAKKSARNSARSIVKIARNTSPSRSASSWGGLRQLQPLLRYAFGVDIEPSYMNLRTFRRPFRLRFLQCSPSLSTSAARATV